MLQSCFFWSAIDCQLWKLGSSSEPRAGRQWIYLYSKNERLLDWTIKRLASIADYSRCIWDATVVPLHVQLKLLDRCLKFVKRLTMRAITRARKFVRLSYKLPCVTFSYRDMVRGVDQRSDHSVMSLSFMAPTPWGYTYPIKSAWQHDRKFRNRETLQELFPFSLSTRRPAFLGRSRIVEGSQTTALAAIPFVAA